MNEIVEKVARAVSPELFSEATAAECCFPTAQKALQRDQDRAREDARNAIAAYVEAIEAAGFVIVPKPTDPS